MRIPHYFPRTRPKVALLTALSVVVVLVACNDALTNPQSSAPSKPQPGAAASRTSSPGDSPDGFTVSLVVDPLYGSADVPPGTTLPEYPHPTVVKAVAEGFVNGGWNYTGVDTNTSFGPSGKAFLFWDDGVSHANRVDFAWGGFVEPSVTTYITFTGIGKVVSMYRSLLGVITLDGYRPPGQGPIYCGSPPRNPCVTYSGSPKFTLTRLNADLSVTAESASVAPGSTPYFDYRASPMAVDGQNMPFVIDSTHWIPDNDGSGGEGTEAPVHAAGRGACQSEYNPACRRRIIGSGTFTMSAWVNGKLITKSAHVTTPTLELSPSPSTAFPGQAVTFTPSWSDGHAIAAGEVTGWAWRANVTPALTGSCAAGVRPCITPVRENGAMTVAVTRNGVVRTAMALVGVRDKYELRARPTMIAAGQVVTFRPYLNDQPAPATRWRWIGGTSATWDNVAGCTAGAMECHRATFTSGIMWAYRDASAGDSAAATVTVNDDCGIIYSRQPSPRNRAARTAGGATCSDTTETGGDAGTDSLPPLALKMTTETDGVDGSPRFGTTYWPTGTVVPYHFTPKQGYEEPVVFLDDTLVANTGTITMMRERTVVTATDTIFASRPGIAQLRQRLRALATAQNKPSAYAEYLTWYLNTLGDTLSAKISLAEYLEFDPVTDAAVLSQFDDALANYAFEVNKNGVGYTITTLAPPDYSPPLAMAARANRSATSTVQVAPDSTVFIFVNGIRTLSSAMFQTATTLNQVVNDPARFQHSKTTFYWNRNIHGEVVDFSNAQFGCAGSAVRNMGFRNRLTTLVRYARCKTLNTVSLLLADDLGYSAGEFVRLQWGGRGVEDPDSDRLARLVGIYHRRAVPLHTILVTHSQGNMVFADAVPKLPAYYDRPLQDGACTGVVSLASPITQAVFGLDYAYMDGLTIKGDILLLLNLPNDFPHLSNETSDAADAAYAQAPAHLKPFVPWAWGFRIHDVEPNYFHGRLKHEVTVGLERVYNACHQ